MPIVLNTKNWNSEAIEASLDASLFYIVLNWNESNQNWTLGIRNSSYRTIIAGISLTPNYPLTYQFRYGAMPRGELTVMGRWGVDGPIPRDGFETGQFELVYTSEEELEAIGLLPRYGRTTPDAF